MYVVSVGTVAAKFKIPKSADRTYLGLYMSTHDNIASCMMLLDVDLVVRLMVGGSSSSSWEMFGASCGRESRWSCLGMCCGGLHNWPWRGWGRNNLHYATIFLWAVGHPWNDATISLRWIRHPWKWCFTLGT
jgi:hypothetical protein